ncbi:MAG: methionine--tRNA ligase [Candidatus Liptonbacteria bacterium]|nr:methionine--tRNA ligase [Candidatus Liptonbacteria bacterium]
MEQKKFYITTTLPYVNAAPHIGFALELAQADVIARHQASRNKEIFFNTGTDEHGIKIYRKAEEEGKKPQEFVDEYAEKFRALVEAMNVSYTNFIRTTDAEHKKAAAEFWKRCAANVNEKGESDIYKATYRTKYCVGCELEKSDSELENGRCPTHLTLAIEEREEENYFFRFSRYEKPLVELYNAYPDFVVPDFRLTEIQSFVKAGLRDFSISRLKEKMPWGVPVPGDSQHVMYVWFDALINYISTLGWPASAEAPAGKPAPFYEWWGTREQPNAFQIAGKDNLRQQSAMWQAMLMSAGLPNSRKIFIHGFITSGGEKMSKTLGNVIDPMEVIRRYGTDPVRYYLLREIPTGEDGDWSEAKFKERYNADLANGLGNFVARVLALAAKEKKLERAHDVPKEFFARIQEVRKEVAGKIDSFRLHEALAALWELITFGDEYTNKKEPWKIKDEKIRGEVVFTLLSLMSEVGEMLVPFLPATAEKILASVEWKSGTDTVKINRGAVLFPRLE